MKKKVQVYLRITEKIHSWIKSEAARQVRSINEQIIYILNKAKKEK
jgi:hypothetical protein